MESINDKQIYRETLNFISSSKEFIVIVNPVFNTVNTKKILAYLKRAQKGRINIRVFVSSMSFLEYTFLDEIIPTFNIPSTDISLYLNEAGALVYPTSVFKWSFSSEPIIKIGRGEEHDDLCMYLFNLQRAFHNS